MPHLYFNEAAAKAVVGAADAAVAFDALDAGGWHIEASRLLAHGLPRREAVWWACMCARHTAAAELPVADQRALDCAEGWVFHGEDSVRRSGFAHAQERNFATPEAWAAVAAFWCGESMAPAGQAALPPAPHLAGTAVAGCVLLAAVRTAPERRAARLVRFLASGRDIASGGPGRLPQEDEAA